MEPGSIGVVGNDLLTSSKLIFVKFFKTYRLKLLNIPKNALFLTDFGV